MKGFRVSQRTIARLLTNSWVLACNVQARELEMLRQRQERAELQQALEMKERIKEAAIMLGMDPESGINEFFEKMDETLDYLEEIADE